MTMRCHKSITEAIGGVEWLLASSVAAVGFGIFSLGVRVSGQDVGAIADLFNIIFESVLMVARI